MCSVHDYGVHLRWSVVCAVLPESLPSLCVIDVQIDFQLTGVLQIRNIMELADVDGDGEIDIDEFMAVCAGRNF